MLTPVHGYCPPVHSEGCLCAREVRKMTPVHTWVRIWAYLFNNIKQQFFLAKQKSNLYVCRY